MYKEFDDVNKQTEYSNVDTWHKNGVTGKGIVVWNCETIASEHGEITARRVWDAAPGATIITCGYSLISNRDGVQLHEVSYRGKTYDIEEFIKAFNIRILTKSVGGSTATDRAESAYWNALKEKYKLIFFTAAGNEGKNDIGGAFPPDVAMLVGACTLTNGKPKRATYSSVGAELSFMQFTGVWNGTSFASPYMAGMAALLLERYPGMTHDEVFKYFTVYAEDLEHTGKDNNTGFGLAKMGEFKMIVEVPIGSKTIKIDGVDVAIDQPATINGLTKRTLVPLRVIAEAFGAEVTWDNAKRTVIITK